MKEILDMKYSKEDFVGDLDPSDDDSWLQEGAEVEIEEEMKYRESEREEWEKKKEGKGKSRKVDAEEVALSMKSFLEMEGSLEGAELTSAKRSSKKKNVIYFFSPLFFPVSYFISQKGNVQRRRSKI